MIEWLKRLLGFKVTPDKNSRYLVTLRWTSGDGSKTGWSTHEVTGSHDRAREVVEEEMIRQTFDCNYARTYTSCIEKIR